MCDTRQLLCCSRHFADATVQRPWTRQQLQMMVRPRWRPMAQFLAEYYLVCWWDVEWSSILHVKTFTEKVDWKFSCKINEPSSSPLSLLEFLNFLSCCFATCTLSLPNPSGMVFRCCVAVWCLLPEQYSASIFIQPCRKRNVIKCMFHVLCTPGCGDILLRFSIIYIT